MGYPKNIGAEEKWAQKREEHAKETNENKRFKWTRLVELEK